MPRVPLPIAFIPVLLAALSAPSHAGLFPPPTLNAPNGVAVSTSNPTFVWDHSAGANGFRFQLGTDLAMTQVIADSATFNNSYHSTAVLVSPGTYYWRVRHDALPEEWSSVMSFGVDHSTPAALGVEVSADGGASWPAVSTTSYLRSGTLSFRLTAQDSGAGLLVSAAAPAGLVGEWHLDESSGTDIQDTSGSGFDGTLDISSWSAGRFGPAVYFSEARSNQVLIPQHVEHDPKDDFTVAAWINSPAAADTNMYVLSNGGLPYTNGYSLVLNYSAAGNITFLYNGAAETFRDYGVMDGAWHHLAVAVTGGYSHLYVDGVWRASSTVTTENANTTQLLAVGSRYDSGAGTFFSGGIDELRIYNVVRSSVEILAEYQSNTLSAHDDTKSYSVAYSTNFGASWNRVPAASLSLTGSNGDQAARILQANSLSLVSSTGTGAFPNRVAFSVADLAGNVSRTTWTVLVDTISAPAQGSPRDAAFVAAAQPVLQWTDSGSGSPYRLQLALDAGFTAVLADSVTANAYYPCVPVLASGTSYYWRVRWAKGDPTNWSPVRYFTVDTGSPTLSSPQISAAAGSWSALPSGAYLIASTVSVRIGLRDTLAGLMASTALPAGLVGQWHLDESSGVTALDASTSGFTGIVAGDVARVAGKVGTALDFGGVSSKVAIRYDPDLNLRDNFTVEAWFKSSDAGLGTIVSDYNGAVGGYIVALNQGAAGSVSVWTNGWQNCTGLNANDGEWHHVAVTQENNVTLRVYLDGSQKCAFANAAAGSSGADTVIGSVPSGGSRFVGSIDEVRLYQRVRSAAEIAADFESDTAAAHRAGRAYAVLYSTNAGTTWNYASTQTLTLTTGSNGDTGPQTLQADNVPVVTSTGIGAATNQVAFVVSDYAGNVSTAGPYTVYADTLVLTAVSVPSWPCAGCAVGVQPNFMWHGPSTAAAAGFRAGGAYLLQVSNNDPAFGAGNLVVAITTPVVIASTMVATDETVYLSTYTLAAGGPYYWRVAPVSRLGSVGAWSQSFSFTRDASAPAPGAFASLSSGAARAEAQYNWLMSGATVQLQAADGGLGLAVSTGIVLGGHGPQTPGFGVEYSSDAGATWLSEATSLSQGGLQNGATCFAVYNGKLYAGITGGIGAGDVIVYDGTSWALSYDGAKTGISALAAYNGKLYAAQSGATGDGDLLVFDGSSWSVSFNGSQEAFYALAVYGDKLFAGQGATSGDGDIYVFDGLSWQKAYERAQSAIYSLAVYNGRLYAGQGGVAGAGDIYVFNGSTWTSSYDGAQQAVYSMAVYDGKLYAGQGGVAGGGDVLAFDGTSWSTSWDGPQAAVHSLASFNGRLFAGQGSAAGAGDLVEYDGSSWSAAYDGSTSRIFALMPYNGDLFLGVGGGGADGAVLRRAGRAGVALTGSDGATGSQTLSLAGPPLAFSTNTTVCGGAAPCGSTNQVRFHVSDRAGNVLHGGPYTVLVDTNPPAAPGGLTGLAVSSLSLQVSWQAAASSHPVVYQLEASTASDYSGTRTSSTTQSRSALLPGLWPNTTYYSHVRAWHVSTGAYSAGLQWATLAKPASGQSAAAVYGTSLTVSWTPLPPAAQQGSSNAAQGYTVLASTAADLTGDPFSSSTPNGSAASLTLTGLARATTYYFRVMSLNWAGSATSPPAAGWAPTLPGGPPGSPAVGGVYSSSITASWSLSGAYGYALEAAKAADFSGTILSSVTTSATAVSLTVQGLDPNTTHYIRVGALWNGTTAYASPSSQAWLTLANIVPAAAPAQMGWSSATVSWTALPAAPQSAACEGYRVEASTAPDLTGTVFSSATTAPTAASLVVSGLAGDTTYYFRVGTRNWIGALNYRPAGSGMTTPPAPGSPALAAVFTSSVSAQWTPVASKSGYVLEASAAANFSGGVFSSRTTDGGAAGLAVQSLDPNTTYYLRVGALRDATTAYALVPGSTATLANPVAGTISRSPFLSSVTVAWTALPAAPQSATCEGYRLEAALAADFSGILRAAARAGSSGSSLSMTGLAAHTTYYFRLATLNWSSAPNFVAAGSTVTGQGPPPMGGAFFAVFRDSATVSWTAAGAQDGYIVELAAASDFSGTLLSSATASGAASRLSVTGLDPNTTYYARVGSLWNGATSYSIIGSTPTRPQLVSAPLFAAVELTSVTVAWTALPAAPMSVTAEGYRLEASESADFSGLVFSSVTYDPLTSSLTLSSMTANATYYFRVGSIGWDAGVTYLYAGSTKTLSITASSQTGTNSAMTLTLTPSFQQLTQVSLEVPAGAFPAGTRVELGATVAHLPPARSNQARLIALGDSVGVELSAQGLQPLLPVTLRMSYDPALFPAGAAEGQLVIAAYSPEAGQWSLVKTTLDSANRRISCQASHFSLWAPFLVAAGEGLADFQVFPVPWEPGSGSRYDTDAVSFMNLPLEAKVEIFTMRGESLWEGSADAAGIVRWDGRSRAGNKAASGTYIAVVRSGKRSATRRVVVIR